MAGRLKIGNWFDFHKNVDDDIDEKIIKAQESITNIGNLNVQLQSEEAARVFVKSLVEQEANYPLNSTSNEVFPLSKRNLVETRRLRFVQEADILIATVTPLLRLMYIVELVKNHKEHPEIFRVIPTMPIDTIINELHIELINDEKATLIKQLPPIMQLAKMREDIYQRNADPPSDTEISKIISEAKRSVLNIEGYATASINAYMMVLWTVLKHLGELEKQK
ncbi:hypothetical protein ACFLYF_02720 [Chloroflexota bacterium]